MSRASRLMAMMAVALAPASMASSSAGAATLPAGFDQQTLVSNLSRPTAVAWAPDGRMFIASKDGTVQVVSAAGTLSPTPLIDISSRVNNIGDRGLLGIAVDSDYANPNGSHRYLYLLYTYAANTNDSSAPQVSQLLRVVVNPDNSTGAQQVLLGSVTTAPCPAPSNTSDCIPSDRDSHSIGTVRSDPDGTLWTGSGDAADYNVADPLALRSYNVASFAGKITHIDRNGNGLPGHPFCPSDNNLSHVCTKLYAKGFRNPFRFTLRSGGAGPAVGDVGWYAWEELNLTQSGKDYGWPCWEGNGHTPSYEDMPECTDPGGQYHAGAQLPDYTFSHASGGVAVVGGPTYTGTDFPSGYRGTIFFGDYGSGLVKRWDPVSQTAIPFASAAPSWVDLESAPAGLTYAHGGDLFYVNIGNFGDGEGTVGRVFYTSGNRLPVARASGAPTAGDPPLTVTFKGDTSSDPDNDPITYSWDFGDGSTRSTQVNPVHRYTTRGRYTARLTVTDNRGASGSATVVVTVGGPTVSIANPAAGSSYRDGVTVPLEGSALDAGGQPVADSGLSWHVILHHSSSHTHDLGVFSGSSTSFTPKIDHDGDSWYDVTLTATDGAGLTGSKTVSVFPEKVSFTLASSPSGALVSYSGISATTPFTMSSAVGFVTSISAQQQFSSGGNTYVFKSWSDGGSRLHNITIPAGVTTLTAVYDGPPPPSGASGGQTGGAGGVGALVDHLGPNLRLTAIATGLRSGRLAGTVNDPSGIRVIEVAVRARHRGGTPCRWWSWRRRALGKPRSCSPPAWIRGSLTGNKWRVWLGGPLPRGDYVVLVQAVDRRGNATTRLSSARRP